MGFFGNLLGGAEHLLGIHTQPQKPQPKPQPQQHPNLGQFLAQHLGGAVQGVEHSVSQAAHVAKPFVQHPSQVYRPLVTQPVMNLAVKPLRGTYDAARLGAAELTHNNVAIQHAKTQLGNDYRGAGQMAQGFARTLPELATTVGAIHDQNITYHPNSKVERTLFGSAPIQNIQAKVRDTQAKHGNVAGLAEGALSLGMDLPVAAGVVKGGLKAADAIHPHVQTVLDHYQNHPVLSSQKGSIGLGGDLKVGTKLVPDKNGNMVPKVEQPRGVDGKYGNVTKATPKLGNRDVSNLPAFNENDPASVKLHMQSVANDLNIYKPAFTEALQHVKDNPAAYKQLQEGLGSHVAELTNDYRYLQGRAKELGVDEPVFKPEKNALGKLVDMFKKVDPGQSGKIGMFEDVGSKPPVPPVEPPQPPKPDMSSTGLPPEEAPSRFQRRIAADPRANQDLQVSMMANGTHSVLHNADTLAQADSRIAANEDQAFTYAKKGRGTDANATAVKLLEKYLNEGQWDRADELARVAGPRFTRQGQAMQILGVFGRLTPSGAVRYATRQLQKAADVKAGRVEGEATKLTASLKQTNAEAADQVAKEVATKDKKDLTPEERLAKRISVTGGKPTQPDPVKDMVDTLHKVAQEIIGKDSKKAIPRNPMELIGQAIQDEGNYKGVYERAKALVEDKYKDNPAALEELNKYFMANPKRVYSQGQLNRGVQQGLKGVDLSKLVKEHYSKVNQAGDTLKSKLVKQAGLSEEEATQLAADIQARFNELTTARKESLIQQMFKDRPTPEQKSAAQKIIEMSNLGVFDREALHQLAADKLGLPRMTPQLAKEITGMAERIQSLPDGSPERGRAVAEMMQHIESQVPQGVISNGVSIWKAGLLSGVKTQGGNLESNLTFGPLLKTVSNPLTAATDKVIALKTRQRKVGLTYKGTLSGGKEGISKGFTNKNSTMRTGIDERNIAGTSDKYEQHSEINLSHPVLQKVLGKPANMIFRGMSAADQPFYYSSLKNSLYDQAKADGLTRGLKGDALKIHMEQIVANPPEHMVATAVKEANKSVLGYDTYASRAISAMHQGIDNWDGASEQGKQVAHSVINLLAPFTRVPSAFLSRTLDFTPIGIGKGGFKALVDKVNGNEFDQRALSQAIGEGLTGTGVIALGIALAHHKLLSGDYPKDPKEQARWKAEGITPNSVKLGGTWISLNYLGPIGLLFNAGDKWVEAEQTGGKVGNQTLNQVGASLAGMGQGLMNQSFLQGFSGFSNAIQDPARNAASFVKSEVGSIVPNISNDIGNITDGMQRQVNSAGDAIKARIPGVRNSLPAKIDSFGNDLGQPSGSGLNTALNPFKPSTSIDSPMLSELNRLNDAGETVFPTDVKVIGQGKDATKLTPAQTTERQKYVGELLTPLWNKIMQSPDYKSLDDAHKKTVLQSALDDVNSAANRKILAEVDSSKLKTAATSREVAVMNGKTTPDNYIKGTAGKDPLSKYQAAQQKYNLDKAAGKLDASKDLAAQNSLNKLKIQSGYSQDVLDFYALSNAQKNQLFKQDPTTAKALYDQAKQLDAQLVGAGGSTKFKNGLSTVTTSKGTKVKGVKVAKIRTAKVKLPKFKSIKITAPKTAKVKSIKPKYAHLSGKGSSSKAKQITA